MIRFCSRLWAALIVVGSVAVAQAQPVALGEGLSLYEAWQDGMGHDAKYRAAMSRYRASQEQEAISRGGLLPQARAAYSRSRIQGWQRQPGGYFAQLQRSDLRYNSTNVYLQLNQALLNYPSYAEYRRGQAVARFGAAQFGFDTQQSGLEIAQAYYTLVLALEKQEAQRQRVQFFSRRVQNFEQLVAFEADATKVDLAETQARLDTARAQLLEANDAVRVAQRQLQAHIGYAPEQVRPLKESWGRLPVEQGVEALIEQALVQNHAITAARQQVAMMRARLEAARSRYFPTVDLAMSFAKADSEHLDSLSQRSNSFSVGVNVAIPLFTGGYTRAASAQARFELQASEHRLAATQAAVEAEVHKQYGHYTTGVERVAALKQAVASSALSLASVEKSFTVGAASNLDVLAAQDHYTDARYAYQQARIELLLAQLRLHAALGEHLHHTVQQQSELFF